MGFCFPCCGQIAGPGIRFRLFDHFCPDRIEYNVPADLQEVAVFLDQDCFIPALEQMAYPAVPFIEELRIDAVQLPHTDGKIPVRGLNKKMVMIGHEAIGVTYPVITFIDVLKGVEKVLSVLVVFKDGLLFVATGSNVVHGAWVFYAKGACHYATVSKQCRNVNTKDLTL